MLNKLTLKQSQAINKQIQSPNTVSGLYNLIKKLIKIYQLYKPTLQQAEILQRKLKQLEQKIYKHPLQQINSLLQTFYRKIKQYSLIKNQRDKNSDHQKQSIRHMQYHPPYCMGCLQQYVIGTPLAYSDRNIPIRVYEWQKLITGINQEVKLSKDFCALGNYGGGTIIVCQKYDGYAIQNGIQNISDNENRQLLRLIKEAKNNILPQEKIKIWVEQVPLKQSLTQNKKGYLIRILISKIKQDYQDIQDILSLKPYLHTKKQNTNNGKVYTMQEMSNSLIKHRIQGPIIYQFIKSKHKNHQNIKIPCSCFDKNQEFRYNLKKMTLPPQLSKIINNKSNCTQKITKLLIIINEDVLKQNISIQIRKILFKIDRKSILRDQTQKIYQEKPFIKQKQLKKQRNVQSRLYICQFTGNQQNFEKLIKQSISPNQHKNINIYNQQFNLKLILQKHNQYQFQQFKHNIKQQFNLKLQQCNKKYGNRCTQQIKFNHKQLNVLIYSYIYWQDTKRKPTLECY